MKTIKASDASDARILVASTFAAAISGYAEKTGEAPSRPVQNALAALHAEFVRYAEESLMILDRHRGTVAVLTQALAAAENADSPAISDDAWFSYGDLAIIWRTNPEAARKRLDRSRRIAQPVPRRIIDGVAYVPRKAILPLLPNTVRAGRPICPAGR